MNAELTTEHRRDRAGLRFANLHHTREHPKGSGAGLGIVASYAAQAGQQRQAKQFVTDSNAKTPAIERSRAPSAIHIGSE
ncbi:hypothetical protein D3C85_1554730 [compost metagenome]